MSEATAQAPAAGDVRERVAKIVREAMEDAGRSERLNTFVQNSMWDYTDRILALLRALRGEGMTECEKCGGRDIHTEFVPQGDEIGVAWIGKDCRRNNPPQNVVIEYGRFHAVKDLLYRRCRTCRWWWTDATLAALRSEAPGEDIPDEAVTVRLFRAWWQGIDASDAGVHVTDQTTGAEVTVQHGRSLAENKAMAVAALKAIRAARRGEGGGE